MISPILGGPDRIVAIAHLDETPARTALFSRREIRRVLDVLDALDPDDQRVEIAILPYSAPILVARPRDPVGDAWVAVAGHTEVPDPVTGTEPMKAASAPKRKEIEPASVISPPAPTQETKAWSGGDPRPLKMEEKPAPAKADEGGICEICGGRVTKTQKQMSQLFLSRTLCKACMDKATGKGAQA